MTLVRKQSRPSVLAGAALAALGASSAFAALPAFSGADGAGANVSGGRGGIVYHVTRLDSSISDSGPGTLHYGVSDSNFKDANGNVIPRTIVFDVGGTIWLGRNPGDTEGWDTTNSLSVGSNVTIAGQTAPGGINIAGGQVKLNGTGGTTPNSNTIFRNLTLAAGYGTRKANSTSGYYDNYVYDAMDVNSNNVMVDHVSAFFATDETISCNELCNNTTIQFTSMSQGQNYPQADAQGGGAYVGHAMGSLWSPGSNAKTSLLHNLYAHQGTRLPTVQTVSGVLSKDANGNYIPPFNDVRNNVIYNWLGNAGYGSSGEPSNANFIGNYYKVGPGGDSTTHNATDFSITQSSGGTTVFSGSSSTQIFQTSNVRLNLDRTTTNLTNSNFGSSAFQASANSVPYNGVTDTAANAYNRVLNYVGANWQHRDAIDSRIVNQVRNGTGKITALDDASHGYNSAGTYVTSGNDTEWNSLLALRGATNGGVGATGTYARAANFDSDADGMPDVWEVAHGLNPAVADNNGDYDGNGYTNLEEYLNELAAFPSPSAVVFNNANANSRYAEIGNWTTGVFEPSRYDEAQVNSGSAAIDAVGQHAGTLKIATNSGNSATLNVTAGWIDIAQSLLVGPGGSGQVTQTGGIVHGGTSVVIGGATGIGSYALSGGTLSTPLLTKGAGGGTFAFTGGVLHADRVTFDLTNQGGTLAPGSDLALQLIAAAGMADINGNLPAIQSNIGDTHVNGNLTLAAGTLQIELASLASFDTITVDNALSLGAALEVDLLNGYTPSPGDHWVIGTAGSISGDFGSVSSGFSVQTVGGQLILIAVPEPASGLLALLPLVVLRRRRRARQRWCV
ncbi:MAG TPA: hypothetical protein VLI90_17685 [Tepidisphaeraceae bacterium]|nr:hypothetical protein [Tepidisphaeraceae bacterium]